MNGAPDLLGVSSRSAEILHCCPVPQRRRERDHALRPGEAGDGACGRELRDGVCGRWIERPDLPAAGGDCGSGQPGSGDQAAAELWADVGAGGGVRPRAGGDAGVDGRRPATRAGGDSGVSGEAGGGVRRGERMADAARGQFAAAADSVALRQLDHGAHQRGGDPRLWDDVQGVPAGGDPEHSAVRGDAPVHSGAGELVRGGRCGCASTC